MVLNLKYSVKMAGVTLLETMMAIALGVLLVVSGIAFYQSTTQNAKVNKTLTDMNNIRSAYKAYYNSGNSLSTASTDQASQLLNIQNAGYLPNPLMDAWGQPYVISLAWYSGYITVAIPGLGQAPSDKNCQAIWNSIQNSGGFSTQPGQTSNSQCAFRYRFP